MPTAVPPSASSHSHGIGGADVREALIELRHPAADLLAERERRRVLQVRAADLDDVGERVALAASVSRSTRRRAGSSSCSICSTAAMCIAVGNVSFDDCAAVDVVVRMDRLLAPISPPASSIARFEMTSLAFMFDCVPLPVCQTNSGKWSSSLPGDHLVGGAADQVDLLRRQLAQLAVGERGAPS